MNRGTLIRSSFVVFMAMVLFPLAPHVALADGHYEWTQDYICNDYYDYYQDQWLQNCYYGDPYQIWVEEPSPPPPPPPPPPILPDIPNPYLQGTATICWGWQGQLTQNSCTTVSAADATQKMQEMINHANEVAGYNNCPGGGDCTGTPYPSPIVLMDDYGRITYATCGNGALITATYQNVQICTPTNACGQSNTGYSIDGGACSVSAPPNPNGYGSSCASSGNVCGTTQSNGTIQCDGSCSSTPPANPAGYGSACTSAPNGCGQTNSGTIGCSGCSASTPSNNSCAAPTVSATGAPNPTPYGGTTTITLSSTNANYCYARVDWGDIGPSADTGYFTSGSWNVSGLSAGQHEVESFCYNSVWAGSGWQYSYFTVSNPPTVSASASPNPTPYGSSPTVTLSSTNSNYCYARLDWADLGPSADTGYFTSGSWTGSSSLTPGQHEVESFCYNSVWYGSGWQYSYFTVGNPPTASASVNPNPVNYGNSTALTLSSTNANYCYMRLDWGENITPQPDTGYFTSGTWYTPTNLAPGTHEAEVYCYNSVWYGSGWSGTAFTVVNPPITGSCTVSPTSGYIGDSFNWTTSGISGGNGSYTYSWSGTDGLSGSGSSVSKTYPSYGTKTGSVTVSSAGLSTTLTCSPNVSVATCYGAGCSPGPGCTNPGLCCSQSPGVCPVPPTATLSADAVDINIGQSTTLRWSCAGNATSYNGNGVIGSGSWPGTSSRGTGILNSAGPQTYQLTCSGAGGTSAIASATVTVHAPSATINANPARVSSAPGNTTTLTWAGTDVTSCVVSGPGVSVSGNANGSGSFTTQSPKTVTITGQSVYTITCQTAAGTQVTKSVTVTVPPGFTEF